jgi:hypothetical protein
MFWTGDDHGAGWAGNLRSFVLNRLHGLKLVWVVRFDELALIGERGSQAGGWVGE